MEMDLNYIKKEKNMTLEERLNLFLNEYDKVNEKSDPDDEYEKFFRKKLKEYGVKSPDELSKKKQKQFYNEIEKEWVE